MGDFGTWISGFVCGGILIGAIAYNLGNYHGQIYQIELRKAREEDREIRQRQMLQISTQPATQPTTQLDREKPSEFER